jgi:hypothetical protein
LDRGSEVDCHWGCIEISFKERNIDIGSIVTSIGMFKFKVIFLKRGSSFGTNLETGSAILILAHHQFSSSVPFRVEVVNREECLVFRAKQ